MKNCPKCNERLVTGAYHGYLSFEPDSEPYESGVREEVDFDIDEEVSIGVLWCPEHGIQVLWVNEPQLLLTMRAPGRRESPVKFSFTDSGEFLQLVKKSHPTRRR